MVFKMKENYEKNEAVTANQQVASPENSYIHKAEKIESSASASIVTNINKNNNQEILPKDCVYAESIKGKFSWKAIEGYYVPYIIRVINGEYLNFVSVRIAETDLLRKYIHYLNADIYTCTSIKSHFISEPEAMLLNEINQKHACCRYGKEMFVAEKDKIVSLEDAHEFYKFIDICKNRLLCSVSPGDNNKCGYIRINSESVIPYCAHDGQKYVPTFCFEGAIESLISRALKFENWNLAYLKFCLKVQGTINELFDSDSCAMVSIDYIKNSFTPDTKFEEYWPATVDIHLLKYNNINPSGAWIRAPAEAVPAKNTIPCTLIEPEPLTPQSIPVTKNTNQHRCPANQMINSYTTQSQPQQPSIDQKYSIPTINQSIAGQCYNSSSAMSQGSSLINNAGNVVRPSPLVGSYVLIKKDSPVIGSTVSHLNSQRRQYVLSTHTQQRNVFKSVGKIVILSASETNVLSSSPSSPVPPTVQDNFLCPHLGCELTRIPERTLGHDASLRSAYKIQKATLQGRVIYCINAQPYIYSDLMVTLSELVKIVLPMSTIRCANVLTKHLKMTLYIGNSEQLALLRENGCLWSIYADETPMAMVQEITRVFPQLKTLVYKNDEELQQYQQGLFKRQKLSSEGARQG